MTYEVTLGDTVFSVSVEATAEGYLVGVDGKEPHQVDFRELDQKVWSLLMGGRSYEVGLQQDGEEWSIDVYGVSHQVSAVDPRRKALRLAGGSDQGLLKTAMPGRVVRLLVAEGDSVAKGQPIIVVEAMKMENEMKAPTDGVIKNIRVEEGQAVEAGAALILVE
ncbi:MAG: biotin/lipoyl-containing protein [Myxococcota bacterium]|jgi:biotin carboxyl carrier protein|nr:biotin/lipoyl-containing protein [Myxococcota bacterium]